MLTAHPLSDSAARSTPARSGLARGIWLLAALVLALPATTAARPATASALGTQQQAGAPHAIASHYLRSRAVLSTSAWSQATDTYDTVYVHPRSWSLKLIGCRSRPTPEEQALLAPIASYAWRLDPLDGQAPEPLLTEVDRCTTAVELPALGRWRVTLTVTDTTGRRASTEQTASMRDLVVVALGDSFASGQGNPDLRGLPPANLFGSAFSDEQCHRSRYAWPQQAAELLEDADTTVTFLSFACSGAEARHLFRDRYPGAEPHDALPLEPQVVAARRVLGDPLDPRTRQVDALLLSVGVNDLGFSDILKDCATSVFSDCRSNTILHRLGLLPAAYDELEVGISANMRVAKTYIAGYPARIFTDEHDIHTWHGCGVFEPNMSSKEKRWVTQQGNRLNQQITDAAARHDWSMVPTRDAFRGHGYCAGSATWFRGLTLSELHQGDKEGSAHPNFDGHRATAGLVRQAIRTDLAAPQLERLSVRFLRVRVHDDGFDRQTGAEARPWDGRVSFEVDWQRSACGQAKITVTRISRDHWTDLAGDPCLRYPIATVGRALRVHVYTALGRFLFSDADLRGHHPSPADLYRNRSYLVHAVHRRADGWDANGLRVPGAAPLRLRDVHDGGSLEVEYIVETPRAVSAP